MKRPDFILFHHGSVCILNPNNERAIGWCDAHIGEAQSWGRHGVVIEPRYVPPILEGIMDADLTFEVS